MVRGKSAYLVKIIFFINLTFNLAIDGQTK